MAGVIAENLKKNGRLPKTDASYVAAMIDGEGSIGLGLHGRERVDGTRTPLPSVRVANSDLSLLMTIREKAGGAIYARRPTGINQKTVYDLMWCASQIAWLLPQVMPYMGQKRDRAAILLSWLIADKKTRRKIESGLADTLSGLNRRGTGSTDKIGVFVCSQEGCPQRCYKEHEWCYHHWLKKTEGYQVACKNCGMQFQTPYAIKEFCSTRCQLQVRYSGKVKRERDAEKASRKKRPCPVCGELVDRTLYSRKTYCSDVCCQKAMNDRRIKGPLAEQDKACLQCGKVFMTVRLVAAYCSPNCRNRAHVIRKRKGEGMKPRDIELTCENCSEKFMSARPDAKYCSHKCKLAKWKADQKPTASSPIVV